MSIEETHKQEMAEYIKTAIEYLEMAMNVVECDGDFNQGQSEQLNKIYDKSNDCVKTLECLLVGSTYMKIVNEDKKFLKMYKTNEVFKGVVNELSRGVTQHELLNLFKVMCE